MSSVAKPFSITPALDILLRGSESMPIGLFHLHIATAEQLCRLHYSMGSIKAVKAKLRLLCDNGYVQYDAKPTKFTRSPYYYAMDKLGMEYLQKTGMDISDSYRASKEVDKHYLFAQHTLELNDIIISAALLKRSNPETWLEGFIHERELKRRPYKANLPTGSVNLICDSFMVFRQVIGDRQRRFPVIVEHDRGTEEQYFFRRRIRAYIHMLKNEGYKGLFNVGGINIAFTTSKGAERLKKMREWTIKELEETKGVADYSNLFYFTVVGEAIEPSYLWLEPNWFKPYDSRPIALMEV
jgi:hypothetical protein